MAGSSRSEKSQKSFFSERNEYDLSKEDCWRNPGLENPTARNCSLLFLQWLECVKVITEQTSFGYTCDVAPPGLNENNCEDRSLNLFPRAR